MDGVHRHKVILKGRLAGITRGAANEQPAAPPAPSLPAPAPPPAKAPAPVAEPSATLRVLTELERLVKMLQTQERRTRADVAQMSVELGTAIAERLLLTSIAADRQRLDQIVLKVLERMQANRPVTVRGHPDDLALLERQLADHADADRHRQTMTLRRDDSYQRGQLKVETDEWFSAWDTERGLAELRAALIEETFMDD